jgi:hypothetical protein
VTSPFFEIVWTATQAVEGIAFLLTLTGHLREGT